MRHLAVFGTACVLAIGAGGWAMQSHAADLDQPFPAAPVYSEPDAQFELGTGWYLRGDVGWGETTREHILEDLPKLTGSDDWTGGIGAGYRWNNWFRTDLSLNFDGFQHLGGTVNQGVTCAYQLQGQTNQAGTVQTGYFWTPAVGTCTGTEHGDLLKTDVMVGGYIDIGTWSGLTPYVGAGVGFSRIDTWNGVGYYKDSDGSAYKADLSPLGGYPLIWRDVYGNQVSPVVPTTGQPVAFAKQDWTKKTSRTQYNFAWSLMGGVAYAIDDHLSVDLGYRYISLGSYTDTSGSKKTINAQQVRIGVRYAID